MTNQKTIQELEYEIKLNELKKVQRENRRQSFFAPASVTLIAASLSVLGSLIAHFIQRNNQIELERKKFESELIVTAVKTNDAKACRDNLKFLIQLGLIQQTSVKLNELLADSTMPIFQLKSYTNINPIYSLEGIIILPKDKSFENTKLVIWPHSTNLKETYKLRQEIPISNEGRFKVMNLEEIGYVVEIKYKDSVIRREMHAPNSQVPNEFKIFDLTKARSAKSN